MKRDEGQYKLSHVFDDRSSEKIIKDTLLNKDGQVLFNLYVRL